VEEAGVRLKCRFFVFEDEWIARKGFWWLGGFGGCNVSLKGFSFL
jgi:hypothetical protein